MKRACRRCGHPRDDHEHYRDMWTSLAECGHCGCDRYRRRWWPRLKKGTT